MGAAVACKENGMELVQLLDKAQSTEFLGFCTANINLFKYAYVGGTSIEKPDKRVWYWFDTGDKISYSMKWNAGEPNNLDERCLEVSGWATGIFGFNDVVCYDAGNQHPFLCQKVATVSLT